MCVCVGFALRWFGPVCVCARVWVCWVCKSSLTGLLLGACVLLQHGYKVRCFDDGSEGSRRRTPRVLAYKRRALFGRWAFDLVRARPIDRLSTEDIGVRV